MYEEDFARKDDLIYLDTETCGLHSFPVLIQFAVGDGKIHLHDIWFHPIKDTLELVERIVYHPGGICLFNATFDWFHLCKLYTHFILLENKNEPPNIAEVYSKRFEARDGPCLKPMRVIDLFLHSRKGPYQTLLDRKDIRIKRIPDQLVWDLVKELDQRVPLNPIFFARRKDQNAPIWNVEYSQQDGEPIPGFCDIVLRFAPSSGLKALACDALKLDGAVHFQDVSINCPVELEEYGYAPAHGNWDKVIEYHMYHWRFSSRAREYAKTDVDFTRRLYYHFGRPPLDDVDSVLATMVASVRWKGFAVDIQKLTELRDSNLALANSAPKAPARVRSWLEEVMDATERVAFLDTSKATLKEIATWTKEIDGTLVEHPAATRAKMVLAARKAEKENDVYEKLIFAGRFHASFKIIGALSGRMSGADGLNAQGINKEKKVRTCFDLAFAGEWLCKGDFKAFEASIAAAAYNDDKLTAALKSGKKIGGLMGEMMFPDMDYEEIMETEGTDDDRYKLGKNGVFSLIYFGDENTLANKYGIPLEIGKPGVENFKEEYQGVQAAQARTIAKFASITQPGGIGTKVYWKDPAEYVESLLGFRRYFTLENKICKALYNLAQNPPEYFKKYNNVKVKRRDKLQTPGGATMSALYGAAMQIQAAVVRAAGNHEIQSTGAQITKHLEAELWTLQPFGIHVWVIRPMNVHDEVPTVVDSQETQAKTRPIVDKILDLYRPIIALIGMDWSTNCESWGSK